MKEYLEHLVIELKNYSKTLDKTSILVDKPWALIDSDFEMQKLIFKKNKELIMSKDGQVSMGAWDYLSEAKSLLIDRGVDKILCNECFIDDAVLILKLDGSKMNFFILANENIIPDLDVCNYLQQLRRDNFNINTYMLSNGKTLEVICGMNNAIITGNQVTIDAENVDDGEYYAKYSDLKFIISNSKIIALRNEKIYKTKEGLVLTIEQHYQYDYDKGNNVLLNGDKAPDGKYKIIGSPNIVVKDGVIIKKSFF
ncbi:MAG: hypothetical protein NTZ33_02300 [Bacteroidetes bacterium]|nr:hypothetical protein [Bacteroidota bacterium]